MAKMTLMRNPQRHVCTPILFSLTAHPVTTGRSLLRAHSSRSRIRSTRATNTAFLTKELFSTSVEIQFESIEEENRFRDEGRERVHHKGITVENAMLTTYWNNTRWGKDAIKAGVATFLKKVTEKAFDKERTTRWTALLWKRTTVETCMSAGVRSPTSELMMTCRRRSSRYLTIADGYGQDDNKLKSDFSKGWG